MKRVFLSLLAIVIALPVLAGGPKEAKLVKAKGKKIDGSYIVVLADRLPEDAVDAAADELVYKHRGRKDHVYKNTIKGFSAKLSEKEALALAADPRVQYVEEDQVVTIDATQTGATWGLDRIDQRDLPLNSTYVYNFTASGVKAYIIDTGILTTHSQFGGRAIHGRDTVNNDADATDCNGHGTHVAGTVGGSTYGVAKNVTLVAVRVLDCAGSGTNAGVIAGIDWATADHQAGQPAVANMSLGGGASQATDDAVQRAITDGIVMAVAAGNENQNACNVSPARAPNAITVGSTTSTDARSSFSNWGTCLDIFAPGSSITSAWYTSTTATNTISGTSMATPHVAGVAALYLSQFGNASPQTVRDALVSNSTLNKVTSAGTGSPNRLLYSLWGGGGTPAPSISSFSPTSGGVGTSVTINGANFTGASSVRFNGQSASFSIVSASQITATVPNCSSSGAISVTTAGGTATSSGSFSVTGCGGGTPSQLLGNAGFESGATIWTQTSGVIDSSTGRPARTGSWKAWLCGYGTTRTDYAYQTVTIPSTATTATLSFWVRIDSAETTTSIAYDRLQVQISTNGGASYTTLATYSNLNKNSTYVQKTFDLSAYRGMSVRVRLYATEDSSLQTSFVVDDTALNVQ
jgi:uncharacterized protein (TIGR03437 family)